MENFKMLTCILLPSQCRHSWPPGVPPLQLPPTPPPLTSTGTLLLSSVDPVGPPYCLWGWNLGQKLPSDPCQTWRHRHKTPLYCPLPFPLPS